jgi:hypothetical protein
MLFQFYFIQKKKKKIKQNMKFFIYLLDAIEIIYLIV